LGEGELDQEGANKIGLFRIPNTSPTLNIFYFGQTTRLQNSGPNLVRPEIRLGRCVRRAFVVRSSCVQMFSAALDLRPLCARY